MTKHVVLPCTGGERLPSGNNQGDIIEWNSTYGIWVPVENTGGGGSGSGATEYIPITDADFTSFNYDVALSNLSGGFSKLLQVTLLAADDHTITLPNVGAAQDGLGIGIQYISGTAKITVREFGGSLIELFQHDADTITLIWNNERAEWIIRQSTITNTGGVDLDSINEVQNLLTLQDYINTYGSSTSIGISSITPNGDGTITIASAEGFIRTGDTTTSDLQPVHFAEQTVTPPDMVTSYLIADYNGGDPEYRIATSVAGVSCRSSCIGAVMFRTGNDIKYLLLSNIANDFCAAFTIKSAQTDWLEYGSGALIGFNNLDLNLSAGVFFNAINRYDTPAFDTSVASTFVVWYRDGVGGWNSTTAQTEITPSWYDDGTGTINTSTSGWRKNTVWLQIDNPTTLHIVLGQDSYGNRNAAENAVLPTILPPWAQPLSIGKLVGVEVHRANRTTIDSVGSPFLESFVFNSPTNHNELSGLQGGAVDEYFHLTNAQHTIATQPASATVSGYVNTGSQTFAGDKTFSNDVEVNNKFTHSFTDLADIHKIERTVTAAASEFQLKEMVLSSGANSTIGMAANHYIRFGSTQRYRQQVSNVSSTDTIVRHYVNRHDGTEQYTFAIGSTSTGTSGIFYSGGIYNNTTASAANVHVTAGTQVQRVTSSIKYKTNVEDLWDSWSTQFIEKARPVWYDSLCEADPNDWHYLGFIAEELHDAGLYQLVHYKRNEDNSLEPEGVQYERVTVVLTQIAKRQQAKIDELESRLAAIEAHLGLNN